MESLCYVMVSILWIDNKRSLCTCMSSLASSYKSYIQSVGLTRAFVLRFIHINPLQYIHTLHNVFFSDFIFFYSKIWDANKFILYEEWNGWLVCKLIEWNNNSMTFLGGVMLNLLDVHWQLNLINHKIEYLHDWSVKWQF